MADTTYEWKIPSMVRNLADGMVTSVDCVVFAHQGDLKSSFYAAVELAPADPDAMVPYADLDEFTVASWVADKFGPKKVQKIQQALQNQIDLQRTPAIGSGVPWAG